MIKLGIKNTKEPEVITQPGVFFDVSEKNYHRISLNDEALAALNFNKETDTLVLANCDNELTVIKATEYSSEEVEGDDTPVIPLEDRRKLTKAHSSFHNKKDFAEAVEVLGLKDYWKDGKMLDLRAYPLDYMVGGVYEDTVLILRCETDANRFDPEMPSDLFLDIEDIAVDCATIEEAIIDIEETVADVEVIEEILESTTK